MSDNILEIKNLKAYYIMDFYGTKREVRAVDDVTMSIRKNEIYGIAGESSSGKTSLIKVFAAAMRPPFQIVDGTVEYDFGDVKLDPYTAPRGDVDALRWKYFSYIMQGSMSVLNPVRKIGKTFEDFALKPMGVAKSDFKSLVIAHLKKLKLPPEILNSYPHELSGGMRQRVTIALATVCRPKFIIADEPTTALDVVVQKEVLSMIRSIQQEMGASVVFVTHDMSVHANMADRIGIFYAGRLVEEGPTRDIFAAPKHPYTAHLVASLPRIGDTERRPSLEGRPPSLANPPSGCRFHPRCPLASDVCRSEVPSMVSLDGEHRVACFNSDKVKPLMKIEKPSGTRKKVRAK